MARLWKGYTYPIGSREACTCSRGVGVMLCACTLFAAVMTAWPTQSVRPHISARYTTSHRLFPFPCYATPYRLFPVPCLKWPTHDIACNPANTGTMMLLRSQALSFTLTLTLMLPNPSPPTLPSLPSPSFPSPSHPHSHSHSHYRPHHVRSQDLFSGHQHLVLDWPRRYRRRIIVYPR